MADVKALARRAKERLDSRNALNEPDAISKAIKGAGITNRADHDRLMRQVGTQFARDKRDAAKSAARSVR